MTPEPATRKLRTLHLDTERTWRGGEQQALYLATGLVERGHEVELAGLEGSEFVARGRAAGLDVHTGPLRGELNPRAILRVAKLLRRGGFDLVHCHTAHAHTIGAIAARFAGGIPCLVSRRVDFKVRRGFLGINRLKYRRGVARYLAISSAVRLELVAAGVAPERINLVPSGIDPLRHANADSTILEREFGIEAQAPVVCAVGHFAWHKGFETLVDAATALTALHPTLRICLLGDGELRESLRARVDALPTPARTAFVFPGFREDVASFLRRADVVAAPSLLEGLNTSILDALALSRPVAASRVGGIPDAIEHEVTGLLVPPGDPAALAGAISRMLADRPFAERLASAGHARFTERFTRDAMVEGTLAVYRDVLVARGM